MQIKINKTKRKKAQIKTFTIATILAVIFLLVMIPLFISFKSGINKKYDKIQCKQSVMQHAKLKLRGDNFISKIKCKTNKVELEGKTQKEIKSKIAKLLFDCNDIFLRGKEDLFSGSGVFCHVCSIISFKNTKIKPFSISDYLITANSPPPYSKMTYYDFLLGKDTASNNNNNNNKFTDKSSVGLQQNFIKKYNKLKDATELTYNGKEYNLDSSQFSNFEKEINPSKKYATIFWYAKGKDNINSFLKENKLEDTAFYGSGGFVVGVISAFLVGTTGPFGLIISAGLGSAFGGVGALYFDFSNNREDENHVSMTRLIEWNSNPENEFQKLGCRNLAISQN